jgi:hypothetical protein
MKSINRVLGSASLVFALFIVICLSAFPVNANAALNDSFTITAAENSANSSAWNLKYSESENGFKITMVEKNGEKQYVVRSKFFEVAYVLNKNGFGAQLIAKSNTQVPSQILDQVMNVNALKSQKIISDVQIDNEAALNLIASYLPDLINDNYKQLLQ